MPAWSIVITAEGRHEYLIAGCAIKCDVVFSLPKWKTHKKAGITASLKNLVGVNADKNWLPHHTEGAPARGGDEHPNPDLKHRTERKDGGRDSRTVTSDAVVGPWVHQVARSVGKPVFGDTESTVRSGNWFGNDTIWRMCLDLNKIVFYGNADGSLRDPRHGRKRHYVLVDGILAGEGRGPLNPDPVPAGVLLFGVHPPSVDAACAYLMGFDPDKIPIVSRAFQCRNLPLADHAGATSWCEATTRPGIAPCWRFPQHDTFHFAPHFGWKGHIEQCPALDDVRGSNERGGFAAMSESASRRTNLSRGCRFFCRMPRAGTTGKKKRGSLRKHFRTALAGIDGFGYDGAPARSRPTRTTRFVADSPRL